MALSDAEYDSLPLLLVVTLLPVAGSRPFDAHTPFVVHLWKADVLWFRKTHLLRRDRSHCEDSTEAGGSDDTVQDSPLNPLVLLRYDLAEEILERQLSSVPDPLQGLLEVFSSADSPDS